MLDTIEFHAIPRRPTRARPMARRRITPADHDRAMVRTLVLSFVAGMVSALLLVAATAAGMPGCPLF